MTLTTLGGATTAPASYQWEPTDEEIAARYGVPREAVLRFDTNTSPAPPPIAREVLAAGTFEPQLSEYPPSDYRRLVAAAGAAYGVPTDDLLVGAGADEVLDLCAKAFLPPSGVAVIPTPTYAMYRVLTEQRGASVVAVPRRSAANGWAIDVEAVASAAQGADVVWLCSPNNPTGLAEPEGAIEALLDDIAGDAAARGRQPAMVVLDEAYAEFTGQGLLALRARHPNLVLVRTASKAYALAGLRVGFAIARPETVARIAPYRPPGSISTVSLSVVAAAFEDGSAMRANVARVDRERARLSAALRDIGWDVGPSVTNFVLVDLTTPSRASGVADALLRRGLVPRTFGAEHPLAGWLRLTVRDERGNDRLIAAAREIAARGIAAREIASREIATEETAR